MEQVGTEQRPPRVPAMKATGGARSGASSSATLAATKARTRGGSAIPTLGTGRAGT